MNFFSSTWARVGGALLLLGAFLFWFITMYAPPTDESLPVISISASDDSSLSAREAMLQAVTSTSTTTLEEREALLRLIGTSTGSTVEEREAMLRSVQ